MVVTLLPVLVGCVVPERTDTARSTDRERRGERTDREILLEFAYEFPYVEIRCSERVTRHWEERTGSRPVQAHYRYAPGWDVVELLVAPIGVAASLAALDLESTFMMLAALLPGVNHQTFAQIYRAEPTGPMEWRDWEEEEESRTVPMPHHSLLLDGGGRRREVKTDGAGQARVRVDHDLLELLGSVGSLEVVDPESNTRLPLPLSARVVRTDLRRARRRRRQASTTEAERPPPRRSSHRPDGREPGGGQTTLYEDARDFGTDTARATRMGWEILHADPEETAHRLMHDEEFQEDLEETNDDLSNSSGRMQERAERTRDALRGLLGDE